MASVQPSQCKFGTLKRRVAISCLHPLLAMRTTPVPTRLYPIISGQGEKGSPRTFRNCHKHLDEGSTTWKTDAATSLPLQLF